MSRIYQRLRGAFRRNPKAMSSTYDEYPDSNNNNNNNNQRTRPIVYPSDPLDENDDDIDEPRENQRNNIQSPSTRFQGQRRPNERSMPSPTNLPNVQPRPTIPNNTQPTPAINPLINTDPITVQPSVSASEPSSAPPPVNPLPQTSEPIPQISMRNRFPSLLNQNRQPFRISPNTTLVGFPPNEKRQSTWLSRFSFVPQQSQPAISRPAPLLSSRFQTRPQPTTISNVQIDYPIEDVLIDENIPSSIAIKVNEAVEHDRFGNTYHAQHYAYEPKTQQLMVGNNQQMQRRFIPSHPHRTGRRYIREITTDNHYPQTQHSRPITIMDQTPQVIYTCYDEPISYPVPINHYIACAAPNDPMRCY